MRSTQADIVNDMARNRAAALKTTTWLRALALFGAFVVTALPCRALQVSPTYQIFHGKPGQQVKGSMTLTNNEDNIVAITPSVKEWFQLTENQRFTVDTWLKLDDTADFELKPGESKVITYRM